jgi:hypothetical protein
MIHIFGTSTEIPPQAFQMTLKCLPSSQKPFPPLFITHCYINTYDKVQKDKATVLIYNKVLLTSLKKLQRLEF